MLESLENKCNKNYLSENQSFIMWKYILPWKTETWEICMLIFKEAFAGSEKVHLTYGCTIIWLTPVLTDANRVLRAEYRKINKKY